MTVRFLADMLVDETMVIIKDLKTKKVIWSGKAYQANFSDKVRDWDFFQKHVIYI